MRESVRKFWQSVPHEDIQKWDEQGYVDKEFWKEVGAQGQGFSDVRKSVFAIFLRPRPGIRKKVLSELKHLWTEVDGVVTFYQILLEWKNKFIIWYQAGIRGHKRAVEVCMVCPQAASNGAWSHDKGLFNLQSDLVMPYIASYGTGIDFQSWITGPLGAVCDNQFQTRVRAVHRFSTDFTVSLKSI